MNHGQAHHAQVLNRQPMEAHPLQMKHQPTDSSQGQTGYESPSGFQAPAPAPMPPCPPPGWLTPPPPAQSVQQSPSASPWSAAFFTPSPTVSTPATTPGIALTPSPASRRTAPLLGAGHVARSATPQAARPTPKRRISDVDEDVDKLGPSKRPALHNVLQARSANEEAIGRQVQYDNKLLQSPHAPATAQRDAVPGDKEGQDAPALPAAGSVLSTDVVAEDDDNDSLFDGDDDAATTQLALPLCLPGSDSADACPIAYLAGTSAAPAPRNTVGANKAQENQPAGAAPAQTGLSNGAPEAQPPAAPGTSNKSGARKNAQRGQAKPPAPPPSDEDVKRAAQMESERRARLNKAVLGQTPELRARHAWMNANAVTPAPQGSSTAPLQVPASAPPAPPMAGSGPRPRPNLGSMQDRMATVGKRMYPMTGPAPLQKPYWCKTCWRAWVLDTFWYNPRQLEAHVKRKHREQLGTGVWRHEGV